MAGFEAEAEAFVGDVRSGITSQGPPPEEWMFDWVWAEMPDVLARERAEALDG